MGKELQEHLLVYTYIWMKAVRVFACILKLHTSTTIRHDSFRKTRVIKFSELYSAIGTIYAMVHYIALHLLQKQLPRKVKSRLVIIQCAGYIFWQLFLCSVCLLSLKHLRRSLWHMLGCITSRV